MNVFVTIAMVLLGMILGAVFRQARIDTLREQLGDARRRLEEQTMAQRRTPLGPTPNRDVTPLLTRLEASVRSLQDAQAEELQRAGQFPLRLTRGRNIRRE